ncbi:unnamed protein product, partial [Mesorhabditis belari]|uniref:Uncharacterized protein n=1 Tax=Mesorhabditis belari TaxID=2138241 RepID=A0AAF3F663_9BILA
MSEDTASINEAPLPTSEETPDNIEVRRNEVLAAYANFRDLAKDKREKLIESKNYQLFKEDAVDLESWMKDTIASLNLDGKLESNLVNVQAKQKRRETLVVEMKLNGERLATLCDGGRDLILANHFASKAIQEHVNQLVDLWEELQRAMKKKGQLLQQALNISNFYRLCEAMKNWIDERVKASQPTIELPVDETASVKTENVLELLIKDVHMNSPKLLKIEAEADRILKSGVDDEVDILTRRDSVKESWETLMQNIDKLKHAQIEQERLARLAFEMAEVKQFLEQYQDARTMEPLSAANAIEEQLRKVDEVSTKLRYFEHRLKHSSKDAQLFGREKDFELVTTELDDFKKHLTNTREKLNNEILISKFGGEYADIVSWSREVFATMNVSEMPSDVDNAEQFLEMMKDIKGEIDAHIEIINACLDSGYLLEDYRDLTDKIDDLKTLRDELRANWEKQNAFFESCHRLRLWERDAAEVQSSVTKLQDLLTRLFPVNNSSLHNAKKQCAELGRFVGANEQLIDELTKKVELVTQGLPEMKEAIGKQMASINADFKNLQDLMSNLYKEIKTTEDVQQFEKELETINTWMNNSFASRQKAIQIHKKNIRTEGLKHDAFKRELTAYGSRLGEIKKQVEELRDNGYTNAHMSYGKAQERWNQLNIESEERSEFLEAVGMAVQVEREIEQFNGWLTQAEGQLRSVQAAANGEDDPSTINARLKALKLFENTAIIQQETIDDIGEKAKGIETKEIRDAYGSILQRYNKLNKDLNNVLVVGNQQHQDLELLSEIYDELNWAREKLRMTVLIESDDLHVLRIALQKNEMLLAEMDGHTKSIEELQKRSNSVGNQKNRLPKLISAQSYLFECFNELKLSANLKQQYLTMAIEKNKYYEDVREAQDWIDSKDRLFLRSAELKDEESSERAARQHDAFLLDVQVFETTINELHSRMLELQKSAENELPHIVCQHNIVARKEGELSIKKGERALLLGEPTADLWKVQSKGSIGIVPKSSFKKLKPDDRSKPKEMQHVLELAYKNLTKKSEQRKRHINDVNAAYHLNHQFVALVQWVDDRIVVLQNQKTNSLAGLSCFEKDLQDYKNTYEQKMQQLAAQANEISNDSSVQAIFRHTLDDLKAKWKILGAAFAVKEQKAAAHKALDSWLHNAAELDGHISEKEILISEEIIGCDNILITKLKRDYEMAESDMEDMGRLLDRFIDLADALRQRFPEVSSMVYDRQKEICERWNGLLEERRSEIRELVPLYAFLTENQDLCQWIESETIVASSTDTANDVEGIKAMLDQHSELWDDISARKRDLIEHEKNGGDLIAARHLAKKEIAEQLEKAVIAFNGLQETWSRRNELLENALETQKFLREYEQFNEWLDLHETMIVSHDVSGEDVDVLLTRQEDLQKSVEKKRDSFQNFNSMAQHLLSKRNVEKDSIESRQTQINERWEQLTLSIIDSISRIGDERIIQNFGKQAEEMEFWIREKLVILEEIEYLPEKELENATQTHKSLGEEIRANNERIVKVLNAGQEAMNNSCKSMDQTDMIMERIQRIQGQWEKLTRSYAISATRLEKERNRKKFKRLANDLEHWIAETEEELANKDCGSDVETVKQLLKKNDFFEVQMSVYGDKVLELFGLLEDLPKEAMDDSMSFEVVDAETVRARAAEIVERFDRLRPLADARINLLNNTLKVCQLAQKIDDEISWASEKRILAMNADHGRNFSHFQSVLRKHRRLEEDVVNRQRQLLSLQKTCSEVDQTIAKSVKLDVKLRDLDALLEDLKNELVKRNNHLMECKKYHEISSQIEEESYWLSECAEILDQNQEARSSVAIECALKKHNLLEDDLEIHKARIMDLGGSHKASFANDVEFNEMIEKDLGQLQKRLSTVLSLSSARRDVLEEAANSINFHWQCDFIEAWIVDQMRQLGFVENIEDLESIRRSKLQHSVFCSRIEAFNQEELRKCAVYVEQLQQTASSDQLHRHWGEVMKKWMMLEKKAADVSNQLDDAEAMRSNLETLWLEFAQQASAFNSYYESSAEDLTDPIRWCNSSKDLEELWKTHSTFVSSLSTAEQKYISLVDLDAAARKIYPGPNPFTWFDIQAIETTWQSLQQLVQQRKVALEHVTECLMENEQMEKEFASQANMIANFIADVKRRALEANGSLEEQYKKIRGIVDELLEKRGHLKQMDELGAKLERHLLLTNRYTKFSRISLYHDWENLEMLITRLRQSLDQQIRALNEGDIKEEALKEYMTIFRHYDKNLTGYISYIECLKCLSALGNDVGEVSERVMSKEQQLLLKQLDPQNEGKVSIQNFISWMISQETPDVRHGDDIRAAFRALTKDGKPYVTQEELKAVLPHNEFTYCLQKMPRYRDQKKGTIVHELFDYHEFSEQIVSN